MVVTARGWICRACVHVYGGVHGFVALLGGCPVDASRVASGGCACDPGFHGRIVYSPEDGEFVGSCTACAGVTEFQNETGAEECKSCASGHFGIPKGDRAHTACDDARCQRPVVLPAQAHVDPCLCPSDGRMESFDDGTPSEATRCYLQCDRYWDTDGPVDDVLSSLARLTIHSLPPATRVTSSAWRTPVPIGHARTMARWWEATWQWAVSADALRDGLAMTAACTERQTRLCPDCFNGGTKRWRGGTPHLQVLLALNGWVGARCGISRDDQ